MSDNVPNWLRELLDLGLGRIAIQQLALIEAECTVKPPKECPYCHTKIKKWAQQCPKCRRSLL